VKSSRRIVIIGAGVAGLTTALALTDLGETDVTILEQHGPGFGSSGKSAGVVETQYLDRSGIAVRDFGLRYFDRFARDFGISFVRSGYLRLASSVGEIESFEKSLAIQREFGITDPVIMTADEVAAKWPRLRVEGRVGAVFGPSDGHIDSYEFSLRAAALAVRRGVTLRNGISLLTADTAPDGTWMLDTDAGRIIADVVVNAAGPWAKRVAGLFGADMPQNNQLRPKIKIEHDEPLDTMIPFVMDYVPGSGKDGIYFRSETPTELFVGIHTDESIQEERDPEAALGPAPQEFLDRVTELLPGRLIEPKGMRFTKTWTGLYAISPDNKPIVSLHPDAPNVVHVMGAGGSGIQLAPAMGRMAAEIATVGRTVTFQGTDWSIGRLTA
jgi:sarcosine oxidase, subunit beta